MILQILKDYADRYEKKMKLDSEIIRKIKIRSVDEVDEYMKAVFSEFESIHLMQHVYLFFFMILLHALRTNDKEKIGQVKSRVDQGEPIKEHLENLLAYQMQ